MSQDYKLIQAALADTADAPSILSAEIENTDYRIYRVNIPEKFKGLPKDWKFIVLNNTWGNDSKALNEYVIRINTLIKEAIDLDRSERLVLISSTDDLRINDRLPLYPNKNVYYIDYKALIRPRESWSRDASLTPFIRAIRNKLERRDLLNRFYIPYQPKVPAEGWMFFGRKKELESIRYDNSNYFIVGARKIGKTSLLKELNSLFKKDGRDVYYIDVQNCNSEAEVVNQIALKLDAKGLYQVQRRRDILGGNYLEGVLNNLIQKSKGKGLILLIDELGNVILKSNKDNWKIIGIMRRLSHEGSVRIIASGFQEFFLKQFNDFEGPFINFAQVKKLGVLSNDELKDFLIDPLSLWGRIPDEAKTIKTIRESISTHPFILQYLGRFLFNQLFNKDSGTKDIQIILENLIRPHTEERPNESMEEVFVEPIRELFINISSSIARYLFLKFCHEHSDKLSTSVIVDEWALATLNDIGFNTTYDQRRFIFQNMEMRGLIYNDVNRLQYRIAAPIIYQYINNFYRPVETLINHYKNSITEAELNKFKNEA